MKYILIVDDDPAIQVLFEQFLQGRGYSTSVVVDGMAALLAIEDRKPDLVITDIMMDGMDGLALVREIRKKFPKMPIIAISGGRRAMSVNFESSAEKDGADEFMEKPVKLADLFQSIQRLLEEHSSAE